MSPAGREDGKTHHSRRSQRIDHSLSVLYEARGLLDMSVRASPLAQHGLLWDEQHVITIRLHRIVSPGSFLSCLLAQSCNARNYVQEATKTVPCIFEEARSMTMSSRKHRKKNKLIQPHKYLPMSCSNFSQLELMSEFCVCSICVSGMYKSCFAGDDAPRGCYVSVGHDSGMCKAGFVGG